MSDREPAIKVILREPVKISKMMEESSHKQIEEPHVGFYLNDDPGKIGEMIITPNGIRIHSMKEKLRKVHVAIPLHAIQEDIKYDQKKSEIQISFADEKKNMNKIRIVGIGINLKIEAKLLRELRVGILDKFNSMNKYLGKRHIRATVGSPEKKKITPIGRRKLH